ncbi:MAG: NAD(P)-binding protein [Pseudomonadota bacterium]
MHVDYLIVGAGASGLVFADRLLSNSDATMAIIDRRALPGGHWVDSYPYVRLHAPSSFYGVDSMELGHDRLDAEGLNEGFGHCARGSEIRAHLENCLHDRLLPSGRVTYLPMHERLEDGSVRHIPTGKEVEINATKLVDASYFTNAVPATHAPKFPVADGVALTTPREVPSQIAQYKDFVVIGAGKTGMDAVTFLLLSGVPADKVRWIVPRDPWMFNRMGVQTHPAFLKESLGIAASMAEAMAYAENIEAFEDKMEEGGGWIRLDPTVRPRMFHAACASEKERDTLMRAKVIREGYVEAIEPDVIKMTGSDIAIGPDTLVVHCTASAITDAPAKPVFEPGRITIQMLRYPAPCFSAAMIAEIERTVPDEEKNNYALPTGVTDVSADYLRTTLHQQMNQLAWNAHPELRAFLRGTRLDAVSHLFRRADKSDPEVAELFGRLQTASMAAAQNIPKLMALAAAG